MALRWFALSVLLITSLNFWVSSLRQHNLLRWERNDNLLVVVYLIVTFLSVIVAENPLFSGLRWASHALMIMSLLVLLRNSLTVGQAMVVLSFLKAVIVVLLSVSCVNQLPPVIVNTSELYRGAFGSSNALGQIAAVGALLYLHGCLTDRARWLRISQVGMLCLALSLLWLAGSRSALVAFLTGLVLMYYFYSKLMRGRIFLAALLVTCVVIAHPSLPRKVHQIVLRTEQPVQDVTEQLLLTRVSVWQASWTGFLKRPLLGWGFGAHEGIPKQWEVRLTALGTATRDYVNDTVIVLESTGVVGLGAYALLVFLALKQGPTRRELNLFHRIHSPPSKTRGFDYTFYHLHAVTFVCATSLLVLVQFDNTALSAGNFVSATLWVCVTLATVARKKVLASERVDQRNKLFTRRQTPWQVDTSFLTDQHARA